MNTLSQENLDKLTDEYQLVCLTIALAQQDYKLYCSQAEVNTVAAALSSLRIKKMELSMMIDALKDHLHG